MMVRACLVLFAIGSLAAACRTPAFQIGEPCINDDDCQTGACIAQVCGFPLRTGDPYGDAGAPAADATDDGADAGDAAASDAAPGDAACEACP